MGRILGKNFQKFVKSVTK